MPFTASLRLCEECTQNDWGNYNGVGEDVGGLAYFEFTVTFPDDSVLTAEEIELLTSYDFAPIDQNQAFVDRYGQSAQIGTKSIILLALAKHFIELSHTPVHGEVTWQEEKRLKRLAAP